MRTLDRTINLLGKAIVVSAALFFTFAVATALVSGAFTQAVR